MSDVPDDIMQALPRPAVMFADHSYPAYSRDQLARAIMAERERCAKVAEEVGRGASRNREIYIMTGVAGLSCVIATAIRAASLTPERNT
jgi:hypothetical protein